MKIIKYIGFGALFMFLLFTVLSIFLPSHFTVSRSTEINTPVDIVFEEVRDFNNWDHWSPWKDQDSTIINSYEGTPCMAGHKMSWTSKKSGVGSMTVKGCYPNDSILIVLEFADMKMQSIARYDFVANGKTTHITWSIHGDLGFFSRPLGLVVGKMMGPDFEKGLAKLKKYCEHKPMLPEMKIELVQVDEQPIMTVREKCAHDEIGKNLGRLYGEIGIQISMQKLKMAGAPFAFYHSYSDSIVDLEAGIVVDKAGKSNDRVMSGKINAGSAARGDYYGPYSGLADANQQMQEWLIKNNRKKSGPVREVYVTDPGTEKDSSKVLTQIFYPLEELNQ